MTPPEKAKELIEKYHQAMYHDMGAGVMGYVNRARQCAIICCDEIIEELEPDKLFQNYNERVTYWNDVKRYIQSL